MALASCCRALRIRSLVLTPLSVMGRPNESVQARRPNWRTYLPKRTPVAVCTRNIEKNPKARCRERGLLPALAPPKKGYFRGQMTAVWLFALLPYCGTQQTSANAITMRRFFFPRSRRCSAAGTAFSAAGVMNSCNSRPPALHSSCTFISPNPLISAGYTESRFPTSQGANKG